MRRHRRRQGRPAQPRRDPDRRGRPADSSTRASRCRPARVRGRRRHRRGRLPTSCSSACRRRRATTAAPTCRYIEAAATRDRARARVRARSSSTSRRCRSARRASSSGCCDRADVHGRVEPRVPPRGPAVQRLPEPRPGRRSAPTTRPPASTVAVAVRRRSTPTIIITDPASAETIKYAANGFLATKLSFVNAVAAMCEAVGADVDDVVRRHRLRPAHRPGLPATRARAGAAAASRRTPGRCSASPRTPATTSRCCGASSTSTTSSVERMVDKVRGRSTATSAACSSGTRRRRARAHVQGRHRRPARLAVASRSSSACSRLGADVHGLRPDGQRTAHRHGRGRSTASSCAPTRTPPPRAPTSSSCSPSGTSSRARLRQARRGRWPARRSSTPATCSTRPRCGAPGSRTTASVALSMPCAHGAARPHLRWRHGSVVVTGGAGFLGSHLCRALLDRGDEVVAVDNLVTGSVDNIEELFGDRGFTFVEHDVSHVRVGARRTSTR